jgi:hypothetical protein
MPNLILAAHDYSDTIQPTFTSEVAGFEGRNALDGNRHTFVQAAAAGTWDIKWNAGGGQTMAPTYLALTRADMLAAIGATINLAWSTDDSSYTSLAGFPLLLTQGLIFAPTLQDWITLLTATAKQYYRLRFTTGSVAYKFAGVKLGVYTEVAKQPFYPREYGGARAHRGADLRITFQTIKESQAEALLDYAMAVSPAWPAEAPAATRYGAVWGGRPHYLYDALGLLTRGQVAVTPALLHVVLMNPDVVESLKFLGLHDVTTLEYRQLT